MSKLSEQLKIQNEINQVLQKRSVMMKEQASQLTGQAKLAKQLCKALDCKDLDDMEDRLKGINDELRQANKEARKSAEGIDEMGEAAGRAEKQTSSMTAALAGAGAAVGGLSGALNVFKGLFGIIKGAASMIGSVVGGIFKIGKSILSIPFGIFQGLLGMAQSGGGGPSPIRLQLEEIRESVGSLASNEGKALRDSMMGARQSFKSLGLEGLKFSRVFGYGPGGVAEAGKAVLEIANALGPQMGMLTNMTKKNQLAMAIYSKGLGLTAAQMRSVADLAAASGRNMNDYATEVASYAINMGKRFGVSAKLISKDMGAMMEDFGNFGRLGPKVMSSIAVFTRKLGFEAKELTGVIDKFDNFEDAAQSASKLNQVFGIQIDAMQQMKEQDPAKRLANLQQAFAATGKSVENMSRQELKLLASTSGLSEKAAALAFSQKGLSMSYDDVMSGADEAEGKQLSQAEAMKELADSIKKTFGSGGGKQFKGFFDAFTQGFGRGIKRSREFRRVMRNIRRSLRAIYNAGKRVGKAFVDLFPGVKQTFKGLGDLFDPASFRKLGGKLVDAFKDLFKRMEHDPKGGARTFFAKLKDIFGEFFAEKSPAIEMIKSGATKFASAMSELVAEGIRALKPKIIDGLKSITEFIKDPSAFINAAENAGSFLGTLFGPIIEAITEGEGPDSGVTGAFKELFTTLWDKIGPDVEKAIEKFVETYLVVGITTILAKALAGAAVGALVSGLVGLLKRVFIGTQQQVPQIEVQGDLTITQQSQTLSQIVSDIAGINPMDIAKAALNLTLMGAGLAVALGVFLRGMVLMVSGVSVGDLLKALGASLVLVPLAVGVAMGAKRIVDTGTDMSDFVKAVGVIALAGLVVAALGAMGALAALAFKAVDVSAGEMGQMLAVTSLITLLAVGVAFGGAALGAMSPLMGVIALGVLVIGLAGALVVAMGAMGALGAKAFQGIDPTAVKMMLDVVESIVPLAIVVAVGAAAIGLAIAASLGIGAALIVAGMVVLGGIADELGDWVRNFMNKFSGVSKADVEKALIAAEAAIVLVKGATFALDEALSAGLAAALNAVLSFFSLGASNPMEDGMKAMSGAMETMAKYIPKMMKDMVDAVRGASPSELEGATSMLEKVMKALEPMIEVQKASIGLAQLHSALGADPKEIEGMFKAMDGFVSGPVEALGGLISSLKAMGEKLNPREIEGVNAMAGLLGALATVLGAVTKPMTDLIKAAETSKSVLTKEGGMFSNAEFAVSSDFDPIKFEMAMATMANHVGTIVTGISGSVKELVDNLPEISASDATKMKSFADALGPVAKALADFMSAVTKMMGMGDSGGLMEELQNLDRYEKMFPEVAKSQAGALQQARTDALGKFINGILFVLIGKGTGGASKGLIGMIGDVATAFGGISLGEITKAQLGDKAEIIGTMTKVLGDFVGVIKKMAGVGGAIPNDVKNDAEKKVAYLNSIATFAASVMTKLTAGIKAFTEMIIKKVNEFIPPGLSTAAINKTASRIKTFVEIFGALEPVTKLITSLGAFMAGDTATQKIYGTDGKLLEERTSRADPIQAARSVKDMLVNMMSALSGENGLSGLMELFTGKPIRNRHGRIVKFDGGLLNQMPTRTRKFRGQLKTLTTIMGAIGDVSTMITNLKGVATTMIPQGVEDPFAGESRELPSKLELAAVLDGIVEGFGGDNGDKLGKVIDVFKAVAPKLRGFRLPRNLSTVFEMITGVTQMIGDDVFKKMGAGEYNYLLLMEGVMTGVVSSFGEIVKSYNKVGNALKSSTLNRLNLETIDTLAQKIYSIDNMINVRSSDNHSAAAVFTSGELKVTHTFPKGINAKLEITVNLDKVELAKKLVTANFHKDGGQKRISYVPKNS